MFKLKINSNMEKILSITRKLGISFYALLSAAASSKFIQGTKVVLIKICAWGIWIRLAHIVGVIGIIIFGILWIAKIFLQTTCWFLLNTIDLVLIIPLFIVWIFTGKNYIMNLEHWVNEKTGFFEDMHEK